jgi:vancomycin resistance protein VanJ
MSGPESSKSRRVLRFVWSVFFKTFAFLRRPIACLIWCLVISGLLLRLTIRDRLHPWALIYYVTPIPALLVWLVIAGLLWRKGSKPVVPRRRISIARLNLIAICVLTFWVYQSEFVERAQTKRPDDFQIVFWNTARVPFGVARVAAQLRSWNSPVVGLVEANTFFPKTVELWQQELSDYQIATTHFGGLIAVKGTVKTQVCHALLPSSWCEQFDVTVDGRDFTLLLVDISAELKLTRRQPLQELAELAEQLADRPVIIMGDFNTPDDSALLAPLREHCRLAFRERGTGYAATWPMPLPVLTLDQVWINKRVTVSHSQYRWSLYSDHRPLISSISLGGQ